MNRMARKWTFHPHDTAMIRRVSGQLQVSPLLAQVLIARGMSDAEQAKAFLNAKLGDLNDPALLPGVEQAADAVVKALQQKRRITIYGD